MTDLDTTFATVDLQQPVFFLQQIKRLQEL